MSKKIISMLIALGLSAQWLPSYYVIAENAPSNQREETFVINGSKQNNDISEVKENQPSFVNESVEPTTTVVSENVDSTPVTNNNTIQTTSQPSDSTNQTMESSNENVSNYVTPSSIVTFGDVILKQKLNTILGKAPNSDITVSELNSIKGDEKGILDLSKIHIESIQGLQHLTGIKILNLNENQITDLTPISNLQNITELYLENNTTLSNLSGLSNMKSLRVLKLTTCNISNLTEFKSMPYLEQLLLGGNKISNIEPLSFITNLTHINLSGNYINNILPLKNNLSLKLLNLANNNVTDIIAISTLKNLNYLDLSGNGLTDISPLSSNTNLTELYLFDNLNIVNISALSTLTKLTKLNLSNNKISDLSPLKNLTALIELSMSSNNISNLSNLELLVNLTTIDVGKNNIADLGPLSKLYKLEFVNASYQNITMADLKITGTAPAIYKNPLVNRNYFIVSPNQISNGGFYTEASNSITWNGVIYDTDINITFQTPVTGVIGQFSGTISGKIVNESKYVNIPDSQLRIKLNLALGQPSNSNITQAQLASLKELKILGSTVTNLEGLEYCTGLEKLVLIDSEFNDLTPVSKLTNLKELDLSGNNKMMDISPLKSLVNLTNLNLSNSPVGDISILSSFSKLQTLTLVQTQINDLTPLSSLLQLKNLNISKNKVKDITPIKNLINLNILNISYNEISNISTLSSLTNLTELYANNCKISYVTALLPLTKLTKLDISNNTGISNLSPLSNLINLTELNLSSNNITSIAPLSKLVKLLKLDISSNGITSIDTLYNFKLLVSFKASYNEITDATPLKTLIKLKELSLSGNPKFADLTPIATLTSLTNLELAECAISNVSSLKTLVNLTTLNLHHNGIADIKSLITLVNLKELYINNNNIADVTALSKYTKLQKVALDNNKIINVAPLVNLSNLIELKLDNNCISNLSPLKNAAFSDNISAKNQKVTLPGVTVKIKNSFNIKNPLVALDSSVIYPDDISHDGSYSVATNTITWPGGYKSETKNILFKYSDNFNGEVIIPMTYIDKPPVITGATKTIVNLGTPFNPLNGVSVTDEEDGNITSSLSVSGKVDTNTPGPQFIYYSITDSDNNTVKLTREVYVNSAPVIYANNITILKGDRYDPLYNVRVQDDLDGDLKSSLKVIKNNVNVNQLGRYLVTYEVSDKNNMKTTKTIAVTVATSLTETDWNVHFGKKEIQYAMEKGWVESTPSFRPNDAITRAEFIKIVNKAFGFKSKVTSERFNDVTQNQWWYNEVLIALKAGYISSSNLNFRPTDPITREEVANIITTITNTKDKNIDKLSKYTDKNSVSPWAQSSVEGAIEQGFMGANATKFNPKKNITRGESIVTLYRVTKR